MRAQRPNLLRVCLELVLALLPQVTIAVPCESRPVELFGDGCCDPYPLSVILQWKSSRVHCMAFCDQDPSCIAVDMSPLPDKNGNRAGGTSADEEIMCMAYSGEVTDFGIGCDAATKCYRKPECSRPPTTTGIAGRYAIKEVLGRSIAFQMEASTTANFTDTMAIATAGAATTSATTSVTENRTSQASSTTREVQSVARLAAHELASNTSQTASQFVRTVQSTAFDVAAKESSMTTSTTALVPPPETTMSANSEVALGEMGMEPEDVLSRGRGSLEPRSLHFGLTLVVALLSVGLASWP